MKIQDLLVIVGVAAGCALLVGVLGLMVGGRRSSLRGQLLLVAVVAALGTYAGSLAIAVLMFLSPHDFRVITVVSSVSLVVAVAVAWVVGTRVAASSAAVRDQVRALGPEVLAPVDQGPREIRELSAELAEAQRRLESARLRELRLEESRRELVSWVSHDLRTPLAGLRAMAEALEDGVATDPPRFHRQMRVEVDRMAGMIDDLFELSRIQAGVLKLAPEPVALGDLVSDALAGAGPIAQARRVRLDGRVDPGLEVLADPSGLSRVLGNLLMNAIRHTPADGVVEIVATSAPEGVELSVSDRCGGIQAHELERVFDVGWRGTQARTPGHASLGQGAGLGLAIAKGIVEAHAGQIEVENLATDGCRFRVTLPA